MFSPSFLPPSISFAISGLVDFAHAHSATHATVVSVQEKSKVKRVIKHQNECSHKVKIEHLISCFKENQVFVSRNGKFWGHACPHLYFTSLPTSRDWFLCSVT